MLPPLVEDASQHGAGKRRLASLSLLALGIVYGDIGTSPLYALRECFNGPHRVDLNQVNIYGILSLIFWTLVVLVTLKYQLHILRFDNRGEGGILALMALTGMGKRRAPWIRNVLMTLGVFGSALLYGDGMITPAISVMSAVEGLDVATPHFKPYIVPITIAILVALFMVQRRGTAGIGKVFGPITAVWFLALAVFGIRGIILGPNIIRALNPWYGVQFFIENGFHGFLLLGSIFLVATGGEALYADLGHFGKKPIQVDWFLIVGPSLMLQYLGQGALLLHDPNAARHPFFLLVPGWALYPMVALATAATIIASQAIISAVFSLTRQAIQLGFLPRMEVIHTSTHEIGQIYMPSVNRALMIATIAVVVGFGSVSAVADAYGVAVVTTMIITTILSYFVARDVFGWSFTSAFLITLAFAIGDMAFLIANYFKITHGGWFPLAIAFVIFMLMTTWMRGRQLLTAQLKEGALTTDLFIASLKKRPPIRVPGIAVFMHRNPTAIPSSLLHSLKHYKALHEKVILLTLLTEEVAHLRDEERFSFEELGEGIYRITGRYGYMEDIDVPALLERSAEHGLPAPPMETTYFLGRETLVVRRGENRMSYIRKKLFGSLMRNAESAGRYFKLPPNRVVELGAQIEL